jgi:hypothetical protein
MTSWHDPEARQMLDDRKRQRDNEWLRRQVGDATYLTGLRILGYLPRDAETELNLLRMEQPHGR